MWVPGYEAECVEPVQAAEATEASRCRPVLLAPAGVNVGSVVGREGAPSVEPVRGGGGGKVGANPHQRE